MNDLPNKLDNGKVQKWKWIFWICFRYVFIFDQVMLMCKSMRVSSLRPLAYKPPHGSHICCLMLTVAYACVFVCMCMHCYDTYGFAGTVPLYTDEHKFPLQAKNLIWSAFWIIVRDTRWCKGIRWGVAKKWVAYVMLKEQSFVLYIWIVTSKIGILVTRGMFFIS